MSEIQQNRVQTIHPTRDSAIRFVESENRGAMYLGEDGRTIYRISRIRDITRPGKTCLWDRSAGIEFKLPPVELRFSD